METPIEEKDPKNHGKKWDDEDELILETLARRGIGLDTIAKALQRKPSAVFAHVAHKAYPPNNLIDLYF